MTVCNGSGRLDRPAKSLLWTQAPGEATCAQNPGPIARPWDIQDYIAHVTDPAKIPLLVGAVAVQVSEVMPYVASGQITGLLRGMRGSAEYEVVTGMPGQAVAGMDSQLFSHLLLIAFVILGNVGYVMSRRGMRPDAGNR